MRRYPLLSKAVAVGLLVVLLLIPITAIHSVLYERTGLRDQVQREVAESSFGAQRIAAPILVVPYRLRVTQEEWDEQRKTRVVKQIWKEQSLHLLPRTLLVNGEVVTEQRLRGLHKAMIYGASLRLGGSFEIPARYGATLPADHYVWGQPYLAVGIADTRGIKSLALTWRDAPVVFQPGSGLSFSRQGAHAPLPALLADEAATVRFDLALDLNGSTRLDWVPLGEEVQVNLKSAWPHPSFGGQFLPDQRTVTAQGFEAQWRMTHFATNARDKLEACLKEDAACANFLSNSLGVAFIEPVDIYRQADRALKYPLLFIGLTFAAFLLIELFQGLNIHPVQYALVGAALAMFFLILVALSEHLGFGLAYACATAACAGLIGFYARHVLRSTRRGIAITAGLSALYGLLYVVLLSEDYSLAIGTTLLFVTLAVLMLVTRRVDWYELGARFVRQDDGAPMGINQQGIALRTQ